MVSTAEEIKRLCSLDENDDAPVEIHALSQGALAVYDRCDLSKPVHLSTRSGSGKAKCSKDYRSQRKPLVAGDLTTDTVTEGEQVLMPIYDVLTKEIGQVVIDLKERFPGERIYISFRPFTTMEEHGGKSSVLIGFACSEGKLEI